jgi:hypothetical protein
VHYHKRRIDRVLRRITAMATPVRTTVRAFLTGLNPKRKVRVGADHETPGVHDAAAGVLLHDWVEQNNPRLDEECFVMNGRAYLPNPDDPGDVQVFLKPL